MKKIAEGVDIVETTKLLAEKPWKRVCIFESEIFSSPAIGVDFLGIFHLIEILGDIPVARMNTLYLGSKHIEARYNVYESEELIRDGKVVDK